jgi:hypothetical protein
VTVDVAGDQAALLALEPCNGPNGEYATGDGVGGTGPDEIGSDYEFELNIPNLNPNAFTRIDNVFKISNLGTQPVVVYIQEFGPNTVEADVGVRSDEIDTTRTEVDTGEGIAGKNVFDASSPTAPNATKLNQIGIKLGDGDSVKLGIYADTSNGNVNDGVDESGGSPTQAGDQLWNRLKITADAERSDYAYDASST